MTRVCVVLVVDDDEDVRESLADVLRDEGYGVVVADNGEAALLYLANNEPPDVIVLDLMMPVMSGQEFRARQLADPAIANVPVIVMSAADRGNEIAADLKAVSFVEKPTRVDRLLTAIARAR